MANAEKYSNCGMFNKIERPKSFEYKIDKTKKWKFKQILEPKNMKTLFAIDCSGSVEGNELYHKELNKIMEEYYKNNDDIIYMWDSVDSISRVGYLKVDIERINEFNNNLEGHRGTESFLIAEIAKQEPEYREHLLIVTDGEVDLDRIQKTQEILENTGIEFKYVTLFVIGNGDNLSVGAPFCRNCENIIFGNRNGERFSMGNLLPDDINNLNEIDSISNYDEFIMKYESLDKAIQAKMIGSEVDHELIKKLKTLKKIIEDEFKDTERDSNDIQIFNEKWQKLYNMCSGSLKKTFTLDDIAAAKIGNNKY